MLLPPYWLQLDRQVVRYFAVEGPGTPVVLLSGGGWWPALKDSARLAWGPTLQMLAGKRRAIAPEWPRTDEPVHLSGARQQQALLDYLEQLFDSWDLERVALVGFSMGGAAALGYTLRHPNRVERLALVSSLGLHERLPLHTLLYTYLRLPWLDSLVWGFLRQQRWSLRPALRWIIRNQHALTDDLIEDAWKVVRENGHDPVFYTWLKDEVGLRGLNTRYMPRLPELKMPVLLVHGENDPLVPSAAARQAAGLIPDSRLILLPNCGHWPMREAEPVFHRALKSFLGC